MDELEFVETKVAPFAGAWIEIKDYTTTLTVEVVAPFAGAWIEIFPSLILAKVNAVAPFAGAWIEIGVHGPFWPSIRSRSLRGSVD